MTTDDSSSASEFPTEEQTYYEDLIAQWSVAFTGPSYEALFNQMFPIGDQLAVSLREAAQRIRYLEGQLSRRAEAEKPSGRTREDAIEELRKIFDHATYPEITPLAREVLGDEWPELQEAHSYTDETEQAFLIEIAEATKRLEAILAESAK